MRWGKSHYKDSMNTHLKSFNFEWWNLHKVREITIIVYFEQGVGSSRKEERPLKGRALLQNQAQEGNLRGKHNWTSWGFCRYFGSLVLQQHLVGSVALELLLRVVNPLFIYLPCDNRHRTCQSTGETSVRHCPISPLNVLQWVVGVKE